MRVVMSSYIVKSFTLEKYYRELLLLSDTLESSYYSLAILSIII